jgi:hypothetical protein
LLSLLRLLTQTGGMILMKRRMTSPPSGDDSLQVRRAYFRGHRSRPFGVWSLTTFSVTLGAVVSWLFIAGFAGLGH